MYNSSDLIWVKNVKREQGNGWAYMDVSTGGTFYLNWSERLKSNVLKPKLGELILIFQTINAGLDYLPGTYLTHIVTPLENKIERVESTHPYVRLVGCIASNRIPKPIDLNFFKPNRGACCAIELIERIDGDIIPKDQLQNMLWNLFQPDAELGELFAFVAFNNYDSEIEGVYEGEEKVKVKEHKYYERDSSIIRKKKLEASKRKQLFCEACGFDFKEKYGLHGIGFIECHHKYPIAKAGKRKTSLSDLALVCSNCHRMLHKKSDDGIYYKVEELKSLINR